MAYPGVSWACTQTTARVKTIYFIGNQLRRQLNEQRGYVSAAELSETIYQASNTVFGQYRGHPGLYRPGQPLSARSYQLNDVIDVALHPFLVDFAYDSDPSAWPYGARPISSDGVILFPVITDANGAATLENSFQYPTSIRIAGARKVTEVNDNAVSSREANSLTAPTLLDPIRSSVPGGYRIRPLTVPSLTLQALCAPPRCKYMETLLNPGDFELVYNDAASVDVGWTDVTAINEIIAYALRLLGGQINDPSSIQLANQTNQLGA